MKFKTMREREDEREAQFKKKLIGYGVLFVLGIIALIFLVGCWYTIDAGYRGVVLTFGKPSEIVSTPGIHLKIPIAQKIAHIEVRKQKIEKTADSASKDLQDVQTTVALNYHVVESEVNKLYESIGLGYRERIILPAIEESVKAVTAMFTAEELITRRPEVKIGIQESITSKLTNYHLVVDDFNIVNFQFSEEFDKAIEAKVTAEQQALKAQRDLDRILIEKDQKIAQAQAEAEALRLQKQEITPDLIKLREIEVQRDAINKWDGVMPRITGGALPFIDVSIVE